MTDQQLYLTIGIPSVFFALNFLAILAGFFWQSKRFEDMRDSTRSEFGSVRSEIGRVEGDLKSDIGSVRSEINRVEGNLKSEIGRVEATLKSEITRSESTLRSELQRVEGILGSKIDTLSTRVKILEDEAPTPLVKQ